MQRPLAARFLGAGVAMGAGTPPELFSVELLLTELPFEAEWEQISDAISGSALACFYARSLVSRMRLGSMRCTHTPSDKAH